MPKIDLIQGDCLEVMKDIPDKSIDMILCDLPYGMTACKWDTVIPFEPMWEQLKRVTKKNGAIVLFGSQPFTSALVMSNVTDFSHQWIWNKGMAANPLLSKKMPLKTFEDVLVFYQEYDDVFSDWRRLYFKKVLSHISLPKKKITAEIGQSVDHCFRYASRQFGIPTEGSYIQLIEKYKLDCMPWFLPYEKIREVPRVYNPQKVVRGEPVKKGFKGKLKKEGFLGEIEINTLSFNNEYYPTSFIEIKQKK